jgi:outer membrane protein assembly factor BamB
MKLPSGDGSYIHAYDISTGDLLLKHHLPGSIMLGDLTVGTDGGAYLTNSNAPEIYRADLDTVKLWREFPELTNLQGIAKGDSGLYISDYISGIYKVDPDGYFRVSHTDTVSVKGIDGLYYRNGNLVGIQNGVFPMRITQYVLDETGGHIERSIFLDKNLSGLNEPVQGAWVGDWFYFIANSPWPFYDDNMNLPADTPQPEIWRTNLAR